MILKYTSNPIPLKDAVMIMALYGSNIPEEFVSRCNTNNIAVNYASHAFKGKETRRRKKKSTEKKQNSYKKYNFLTKAILNKKLLSSKVLDRYTLESEYVLDKKCYKNFKYFLENTFSEREMRYFSSTLIKMKIKLIYNTFINVL